MWNVYLESRTWRTKPSNLFGIADEYVAYCLDEAVAMVGNHITNELEKIQGKNGRQIEGRRQAALNRMLGKVPQFKTPIPTAPPEGN